MRLISSKTQRLNFDIIQRAYQSKSLSVIRSPELLRCEGTRRAALPYKIKHTTRVLKQSAKRRDDIILLFYISTGCRHRLERNGSRILRPFSAIQTPNTMQRFGSKGLSPCDFIVVITAYSSNVEQSQIANSVPAIRRSSCTKKRFFLRHGSTHSFAAQGHLYCTAFRLHRSQIVERWSGK